CCAIVTKLSSHFRRATLDKKVIDDGRPGTRPRPTPHNPPATLRDDGGQEYIPCESCQSP
ncbi:MAG: hypothetical protein KAJ53_03605, partial [Anaerolineales bacterium]|nr:hypothetical protein [Anaerolineales bacterium]